MGSIEYTSAITEQQELDALQEKLSMSFQTLKSEHSILKTIDNFQHNIEGLEGGEKAKQKYLTIVIEKIQKILNKKDLLSIKTIEEEIDFTTDVILAKVFFEESLMKLFKSDQIEIQDIRPQLLEQATQDELSPTFPPEFIQSANILEKGKSNSLFEESLELLGIALQNNTDPNIEGKILNNIHLTQLSFAKHILQHSISQYSKDYILETFEKDFQKALNLLDKSQKALSKSSIIHHKNALSNKEISTLKELIDSVKTKKEEYIFLFQELKRKTIFQNSSIIDHQATITPKLIELISPDEQEELKSMGILIPSPQASINAATTTTVVDTLIARVNTLDEEITARKVQLDKNAVILAELEEERKRMLNLNNHTSTEDQLNSLLQNGYKGSKFREGSTENRRNNSSIITDNEFQNSSVNNSKYVGMYLTLDEAIKTHSRDDFEIYPPVSETDYPEEVINTFDRQTGKGLVNEQRKKDRYKNNLETVESHYMGKITESVTKLVLPSGYKVDTDSIRFSQDIEHSIFKDKFGFLYIKLYTIPEAPVNFAIGIAKNQYNLEELTLEQETSLTQPLYEGNFSFEVLSLLTEIEISQEEYDYSEIAAEKIKNFINDEYLYTTNGVLRELNYLKQYNNQIQAIDSFRTPDEASRIANCSSSARLGVALFRRLGIPAIFVGGDSKLAKDTYSGHAWIRYYDKESSQWKKIDVTPNTPYKKVKYDFHTNEAKKSFYRNKEQNQLQMQQIKLEKTQQQTKANRQNQGDLAITVYNRATQFSIPEFQANITHGKTQQAFEEWDSYFRYIEMRYKKETDVARKKIIEENEIQPFVLSTLSAIESIALSPTLKTQDGQIRYKPLFDSHMAMLEEVMKEYPNIQWEKIPIIIERYKKLYGDKNKSTLSETVGKMRNGDNIIVLNENLYRENSKSFKSTFLFDVSKYSEYRRFQTTPDGKHWAFIAKEKDSENWRVIKNGQESANTYLIGKSGINSFNIDEKGDLHVVTNDTDPAQYFINDIPQFERTEAPYYIKLFFDKMQKNKMMSVRLGAAGVVLYFNGQKVVHDNILLSAEDSWHFRIFEESIIALPQNLDPNLKEHIVKNGETIEYDSVQKIKKEIYYIKGDNWYHISKDGEITMRKKTKVIKEDEAIAPSGSFFVTDEFTQTTDKIFTYNGGKKIPFKTYTVNGVLLKNKQGNSFESIWPSIYILKNYVIAPKPLDIEGEVPEAGMNIGNKKSSIFDRTTGEMLFSEEDGDTIVMKGRHSIIVESIQNRKSVITVLDDKKETKKEIQTSFATISNVDVNAKGDIIYRGENSTSRDIMYNNKKLGVIDHKLKISDFQTNGEDFFYTYEDNGYFIVMKNNKVLQKLKNIDFKSYKITVSGDFNNIVVQAENKNNDYFYYLNGAPVPSSPNEFPEGEWNFEEWNNADRNSASIVSSPAAFESSTNDVSRTLTSFELRQATPLPQFMQKAKSLQQKTENLTKEEKIFCIQNYAIHTLNDSNPFYTEGHKYLHTFLHQTLLQNQQLLSDPRMSIPAQENSQYIILANLLEKKDLTSIDLIMQTLENPEFNTSIKLNSAVMAINSYIENSQYQNIETVITYIKESPLKDVFLKKITAFDSASALNPRYLKPLNMSQYKKDHRKQSTDGFNPYNWGIITNILEGHTSFPTFTSKK